MSDLPPAFNPVRHVPGRFWALVPCAGTGTRAVRVQPGAAAVLPKQYQVVAGHPMVLHTLAAFAGVARLAGTLVAVAPGDAFFDGHAHPAFFAVPCGGATRADTVLGGIKALQARGASDDDWVLVHDAARPCLSMAQLDGLIDAVGDDEVGGILAVPVADTLKRATPDRRIEATVPREHLWQAQTPQMFRYGLLREALMRSRVVTDEAGAIEALGQRPLLVAADAANLKVTYPADLALAERILLERMK